MSDNFNPGLSQDEFAAYAADAKPAPLEGGDLLTRISNTVREIMAARDDVKEAEEVLKLAQSRVRTLEEFTLPEMMNEAGQKKLTTKDNYDVELDEVLRASIPAGNQSEAFIWLIEHDQEAIIKREVKLQFGKGENERAEALLKLLVSNKYSPSSDKRSVHPQTLAATLRELLEEGVDVPLPLLGAHVQPIVKIKERKAKA